MNLRGDPILVSAIWLVYSETKPGHQTKARSVLRSNVFIPDIDRTFRCRVYATTFKVLIVLSSRVNAMNVLHLLLFKYAVKPACCTQVRNRHFKGLTSWVRNLTCMRVSFSLILAANFSRMNTSG